MKVKPLFAIAAIAISVLVGASVALVADDVRNAPHSGRPALTGVYEAARSLLRSVDRALSPATPATPPGTTREAATRASAADPPSTRADPVTGPANNDRGGPWLVSLISALAWPLTLIAALLLIAFNHRLRRILGAGSKLVRKVSAGGVEMEISSEAVDQVRAQLKGSFRELVANARDEYERMADLQDVDLRLQEVLEGDLLKGFRHKKGLRATVHVPDIIFQGYLYQLVDYYPRGEGAHRRFSHRYGIIGQSWRSKRSHGKGKAFASASSEEDLVEHWGMTQREARGKLNHKPSCLSVVLRFQGLIVGVLYADSDEENAFGDDIAAQNLAEALQARRYVASLARAVGRALAPLRAAAPNLDIDKLG